MKYCRLERLDTFVYEGSHEYIHTYSIHAVWELQINGIYTYRIIAGQ